MAVITDATLAKVKTELQKRNQKLREFVDLYAATTWDTVQLDVKAGLAPTKYAVGTELVCQYNYGGTERDFPWIVVDNDREVIWEDGTTHPGMILQAKFATIESVQFDAPESNVVDTTTETVAVAGWYYWGKTGDTYTALNLSAGDAIPAGSYESIIKCAINSLDVVKYGYNRYLYSAYRQWLNSAADVGEWWEAQNDGDKAPSQLNTYKGFLAGLDADFLAVINPVKVQVAANTVTDAGVTDTMYDKFWLPSIEEMYGSPQAAGIEGAYFPYWKTKTGWDTPKNDANSGRIITALDAQTSAQSCRLRSAYRGGSYHVWFVHSSGQLGTTTYAYGATRCAPACAIS